jgi:hypothetical protein
MANQQCAKRNRKGSRGTHPAFLNGQEIDMKSARSSVFALVVLLGSAASTPAQDRPDFSGTWRLDPSRSESAMQAEPIGTVTLHITQTANEIRIETVTARTHSIETFNLNGRDVQLANGAGRARWFGEMLVVDTVRDVRGVSVTTKQSRRVTADGSEMHVDNVLEVQHGYTLAKTKNYGAGRDVYVRIR